jgi:hypothetical protein
MTIQSEAANADVNFPSLVCIRDEIFQLSSWVRTKYRVLASVSAEGGGLLTRMEVAL